ncbi:MAG: tyrosine recombinase XerC [Bacteroidales bacterium]|nr:tyrosine recombinase XerC [Bacteroidales bacterium]
MHIEDFIEYLSNQKRYSPHTVKAYQNDLIQFFQFTLQTYETTDEDHITHQIIRSWVIEKLNEGISTRSVNRKLSSLKTFYKFLRKKNIVKINPLEKMIAPRMKKTLPEFVSRSQMDLLLDEIDFGTDFTSVRNKLIIEMLYFSGMRVSELVNLQTQGVDLYHSQIKVTGKRNKQRIIPFDTELKNAIEKYLQERNSLMNTDTSTRFFITPKGKPIYSRLVYNIVNAYLSKVSTLKKKSPHILRHTFATHMLNNGADLNAVKELLGHANLSATQVYTHNTIEKLKTIYNQAHPRA